MQLEVKLDKSYVEPKVIILAASMSEEVNQIVSMVSNQKSHMITGSKDHKMEVLEQEDLIRIYANAGKVMAVTKKGEYGLRCRLYEIEQQLSSDPFIRISNSEIINLKQVKHFDLSMTGTICVKLTNDTTTYVSRRYVAKLKKRLGI